MPLNRDNIRYPIPLSHSAAWKNNDSVATVKSMSPNNTYYIETSVPATPSLVMSGASSAQSTSPEFTPSSSSPVTPVTDHQVSNQDWRMPRLSEELISAGASLQTRKVPLKALFPSPLLINGIDDLNPYSRQESSTSMEYNLGRRITPDAERPTSSPHSPHKRDRSGESSSSSLSRFTSRLPSFSNKWRHRKNSSLSTGDGGDKSASTRSSSVTSIHDHDYLMLSMPGLTRQDSCAIETSPPMSPYESSVFPEPTKDPIDRQKQSSTPLLPPKIQAALQEEPIYQNPLQSPSVAGQSRAPSVASIEYSPLIPQSDGLSTRPSISSFQQTRKTGSILETSQTLLPPPPDRWSDILGHANFTIYPKPYIPDIVDRATCQKLTADWELARAEFIKQQARVSEHYGPNSKIYTLSEDKWAEIDAEWKSNFKMVAANAVCQGIELDALHIDSNTNLPKRIPKFNPHVDGKFPTLGDGTIVGPMEIGQQVTQSVHPTQKSPTSRFFRLFNSSSKS